MRDDGASRTAVLVCQGRAVADGRLAVGRFTDPVAARLLRPDELAMVDAARADAFPTAWRERLDVERVAACAELMAPRTVAIDDAARVAANEQVVIVGAGLDGRPWRWDRTDAPVLFAVDHPATQADVEQRSAGLEVTVGALHLVPTDLAVDSLDARLAAAGHDRSSPTTWIWEGVVPYFTPAQVGATLTSMATGSAPGSVLVVNYQSPHLRATIGRRIIGAISRVTGTANPMADEPWRSMWTPSSMAAELRDHGWTVTQDRDLGTIADEIDVPVSHAGSVRSGRVAVAVAESG